MRIHDELQRGVCAPTSRRKEGNCWYQGFESLAPKVDLTVMIMVIKEPTKHEDGEEGGDHSGKEEAARG